MDLISARKAPKAKAPKAPDPTAQLRRESWAEYAAASRQDKDNLKAVIEYMKARGAFGDIDLEETVGHSIYSWKNERKYTISPTVESLPWNPSAPKRIVELHVSWKDPDTQEMVRRGKWRTVPGKCHGFTVKIPHWDYDGVDPLVAREPWERQQADKVLDVHLRYHCPVKAHKETALASITQDAKDMDSAEFLNAHRDGYPNSARFDYCTGPEG